MKLIDIQKNLKENYKFDIVVIQSGFYFNIFNEDAEYFQEEFDFKVYKQGNNILTGFPVNRADYWEEKFILQGIEYAFVEQESKDMPVQKNIIRSVTRSSVTESIDTQYKKTTNATKTQRLKESPSLNREITEEELMENKTFNHGKSWSKDNYEYITLSKKYNKRLSTLITKKFSEEKKLYDQFDYNSNGAMIFDQIKQLDLVEYDNYDPDSKGYFLSALYKYSQISSQIRYMYKTGNRTHIRYFAYKLIEYLKSNKKFLESKNLIIPIPNSKKSDFTKSDNYTPNDIVCRIVSSFFSNIDYIPRLVYKHKSILKNQDRKNRISDLVQKEIYHDTIHSSHVNCFDFGSKKNPPLIILLDDVKTTGSTFRAYRDMIQQKYNSKVWGIFLTETQWN